MTIRSPQTLLNVLDLAAEGATVVEITTGIGGARKSKIIFAWLNDSADAEEFDANPTADSAWCIEWRDKLDWFHLHYREAVADGKEARAARKSPLRAELEQLLAAKRAAPKPKPAVMVALPPTALHLPEQYAAPATPPRPATPRPAYAYRAPPLDAVNTRDGPPTEGRFVVSTHRYSQAERRGGTVEVTDQGIRRW